MSAWLPTPPLTAVNAVVRPAVSTQVPLTETVPGPAMFEQPPVMLLQPPVAALEFPPVTLAAVFLAALF